LTLLHLTLLVLFRQSYVFISLATVYNNITCMLSAYSDVSDILYSWLSRVHGITIIIMNVAQISSFDLNRFNFIDFSNYYDFVNQNNLFLLKPIYCHGLAYFWETQNHSKDHQTGWKFIIVKSMTLINYITLHCGRQTQVRVLTLSLPWRTGKYAWHRAKNKFAILVHFLYFV